MIVMICNMIDCNGIVMIVYVIGVSYVLSHARMLHACCNHGAMMTGSGSRRSLCLYKCCLFRARESRYERSKVDSCVLRRVSFSSCNI